jgi:hypothetical protein
MTHPVSVMLGGDDSSSKSTVPVKGWNAEAVQSKQVVPPTGLDELKSIDSEPSKIKTKTKNKRSYN